jgi:hypothetical protein
MSHAPPKTRGIWLTVTEAANLLDIHNNTLKRYPPSELPYMRSGSRGDRKYRLSDVETLIERRMVR